MLCAEGIQYVDDAEHAAEIGGDGIVVFNHGGRQVDGAVASLDMLPAIVEAVGDKMTVLFDSGIRIGADIFKALALGAKGVLIGIPYVYGLALGDRDGVRMPCPACWPTSTSTWDWPASKAWQSCSRRP